MSTSPSQKSSEHPLATGTFGPLPVKQHLPASDTLIGHNKRGQVIVTMLHSREIALTATHTNVQEVVIIATELLACAFQSGAVLPNDLAEQARAMAADMTETIALARADLALREGKGGKA